MSVKNRYIIALLCLTLGGFVCIPSFAHAQTAQTISTAQLQALIQTLLQQVQALQTQLNILIEQQATPQTPVVKTSSLTILSPNGGETWTQGMYQKITWRDAGFVGGGDFPSRYYSVKLIPYSTGGDTCPATGAGTGSCVSRSLVTPYVIADYTGSYSSYSSYSWNVGKTSDGRTIPNGPYTVQVCVANTGNTHCDISDSYFKIISSSQNTPIISGVSGPQSLNVGETGTWKIKASDSSGGTLSYSVDWGDAGVVCPSGVACTTAQSFQQSATFTHSYAKAGTYTPTFTVTNNNGQSAKTSLSVRVNSIITRPFKITFPSLNSQLKVGQKYNITWTGSIGSDLANDRTYKISLSGNGMDLFVGRVSVYAGYYTWTIPKTVSNGNYLLHFELEGTTAAGAYANSNLFTITSPATPSITVLSPNGGETWFFGVPLTFQWSSTGIVNGKTFGLYLQSTSNLSCKIADVNALDGVKNIILQENQLCPDNPYFPRLITGRYKFFIDAASATGIEGSSDESDNYFTITSSASASLFGDVNGDNSITCTDVNMILDSVVGKVVLSADQKTRADVDGNGSVQAYDASILMQKNNLYCASSPTSSSTQSQLQASLLELLRGGLNDLLKLLAQ